MKQQIQTIYVEPAEEIVSVVDRIAKSWAPNLVLVFPKGSAILKSLVSLRVLRKETDELGKNTLLVTADESGLWMAEQAGFETATQIPDFSKIYKSQGVIDKPSIQPESVGVPESIKEEIVASVAIELTPTHESRNKQEEISEYWQEPEQTIEKREMGFGNFKNAESIWSRLRVRWSQMTSKVFYGLIGLGLIVVIAAVFISLPKANIEIKPRIESISLPLNLMADKAISTVDVAGRKIPAQVLTIDKNEENEFAATGQKDLDEKAKGTITITNAYSFSPQPLTITTRFETADGKIFRTTKNITIPGAKSGIGGQLESSTIDVAVIADQAGEAYNIPATDFTIPGFKGSSKYEKITGKSVTAMSGGARGLMKVVLQSDIDKAKSTFTSDLTAKASDALKQQVPPGLKLLEDTIQITKPEFKTTKLAGEAADKFIAQMSVKAVAIAIDETLVKDLIKEIVTSQLSAKGKQINIKDQKLTYKIKDVNLDKGQVVFSVTSDQRIAFEIDTVSLKKRIVGKNSDQIKQVFATMPEIQEAKVNFWPGWVKSAPDKPERIFIKFVE